MCKHAVKKSTYLLRYVPGWHKTQQMCNKAILENGATLKSVPDCYKMYTNTAFNKYFLAFFYIPDWYKIQEMCAKIISQDPFLMGYVPDQYKIQQLRDEAVDDCLKIVLKFVSNCFFRSKIIKILFTAFYVDENILYFNEDSGNVIFTCNRMGILNIDLNNINLEDTNYDEDDTIILVRLLAWHIKFENVKHLKKS